MTGNEPETVAAAQPDGADEERWLTYLNYDQRIAQAVRRLGALSPANVEIFRELLLKGRDRSRVPDYEAESIRRLQGEAFVGDEDLQRTLIVLNAEDPHFGEELKRQVATSGRPAELDQAVAAIRSGGQVQARPGKPVLVKPADSEPVADKPAEPAEIQAVQAEPVEPKPAKTGPAETKPAEAKPVEVPPVQAQAIEASTPLPEKERVQDAVVVPLRKDPPSAPIEPREQPERSSRSLKPLVIVGALLLVGAAGLVFIIPSVGPNDRMDVGPVAMPPAVKPQAGVAPPAGTPVNREADKDNAASPPLRPASAQPDTQAGGTPAPPGVRPKPVAGAKYKVLRGDMLTDIALQAYGDAHKFRLIQAANPSIRRKPNRLLADEVIFIPPDKP